MYIDGGTHVGGAEAECLCERLIIGEQKSFGLFLKIKASFQLGKMSLFYFYIF